MIRVRPWQFIPGLLILGPALLFAWLNPWIPGSVLALWMNYRAGAQRPESPAELMQVVLLPLLLTLAVGVGMALIVWGTFARQGAGRLLVAWFVVFGVYAVAIWASGSIMVQAAWDLRAWPYQLWPFFAIGLFVIGLYWMTEPCRRRDITFLAIGVLVASGMSVWNAWRNPADRVYSLYWLFSTLSSLVSYLLYAAVAALVINLAANFRAEFATRSCVEDYLESHD